MYVQNWHSSGDGYMYVQTDTAVVTITRMYKLTEQW